MRKKVLVIVVLVALFGFNLVTPLTDFESYSGQSTEQDAFTMSGIGDNTEDYVDQISNLHAPTDLGTHSVFAERLWLELRPDAGREYRWWWRRGSD